MDYHAQKLFEIADSIGWHRDAKGRLTALIDSAANQRTLSSVKSVADLFYEKGILVNTAVNKDLYSGIQHVKSLLCALPPKIYIFKTCVNMIREMKSYWWGRNDRPVKIDDHAMDELRYFVMSQPPPSKETEREKTLIEKDIERLVRRNRRKYE